MLLADGMLADISTAVLFLWIAFHFLGTAYLERLPTLVQCYC